MLHEVLYREAPAWLVGEGAESPENLFDRDGLPTIPVPSGPDDHYPDDYAGKVISVCPVGHRWTKADLAGGRRFVTLELTVQERGWVASRTRKIIGGKRVAVAFDDRWGAAAAPLRNAFEDAEVAEAKTDDHFDYEGRRFAELSVFFKRQLAPTVVHTGAGLYEVGPGKTYTVIQASLDQLFVDQGTAIFTASQYIRIFADTYDENVVPNATLNTGAAGGFLLSIEGDPTDVRTNIHLAPAAGQPLNINIDYEVLVRHMKITRADAASAVIFGAAVDMGEITDCDINASTIGIQVNGARGARVTDSKITLVTAGASGFTGWAGGELINCELVGPDTGVSYGVIGVVGAVSASGCTFSGWTHPYLPTLRSQRVILTNCTIYNCTYAVTLNSFTTACELINCIVEKVTNVFYGADGAWPEEISTSIGAKVVLRNNDFYDYVDFASVGGATKTYAQFIALNRVDAADDQDQVDPLMTAPGSGDYSLASGSPAIFAGHGSGVITGINDVAFDAATPDIGAWSSGVIPAADAPSWAANTSNIAATDATLDGEVDLTWDAATPHASGAVGYILDARTAAGPGAWGEEGRTNGTTFTVPGLTNGTEYDFRVKAYTRVASEPTQTPVDTDSATPTGAAGPSAPAISVVDSGNQDEAVVTVDADNPADVTTTYYQGLTSGILLSGASPVTGDGDETLSGLLVQTYVMYGVAERNGLVSEPSNLVLVIIEAADQYTAMRTALYEWVKGVVGNPEVIWRESNAPQPSRQYVSIKMNPTTPVGSDYHGGNDDTGVEGVEGDREFIFSVQVHGEPANDDGSASISILERIRSSLEKRSIQATLCAAGLAFVADEGFGDLAGIGGTEFEARVFRDMRFRTTYQDTDDVGYIGTVETPAGTLE